MNSGTIATSAPAVPASDALPALARSTASTLIPATLTLWRRDIVRFFRQPSRVVGALASPLVFWVVIGGGVGNSFRPPGIEQTINFLEFFFPGVVAMILLFTAIFSTISLIEDRQAGFLQGVLVSPAPRLAIVLGKLLGGASLATIQGTLFLALLPITGVWPGVGGLLATIGIMVLVSFALTGLGFLLAWNMDSTQGFHAIMNVFLLPMWMLSGSFFPPEGAAGWIKIVMLANPMTYGVDLLRAGIYGDAHHPLVQFPLLLSLGVSLAFAAAMAGLCTVSVQKLRMPGGVAKRGKR